MKVLLRRAMGLFLWVFLATTAKAAELPEQVTLVTHDFPPFSYQESGVVQGPVRVLIDKACAAIAVRCIHRLLPWDEAQDLARAGKADGMYVIGFNEPRSRWLRFSTPLMSTEYGVFVREENSMRYAAPDDLSGYRIGVYGPSNTSRNLARLLRNSEGASMEIFIDNETSFNQLARGELDAVYSNREVGLAMIRQLRLEGIRYAGPSRKLDYYVGFSRLTLDADFNLAFSRAYQQLEADGEVRRVLMAHGILPGI